MSKKLKSEFPLKLLQVIDDRNSHSPLIFEYSRLQTPPNKTLVDELALLQLKYKALRIEVDEKVPVHSRVDDHRWYLTKDRFGVFYIMLVSSLFEEKLVYKAQVKMQQVISRTHDELTIGSEQAFEETRALLNDIAEQYNNALSSNAQADILFSMFDSKVQIVEKEAQVVEIGGSTVKSFEDPKEFAQIMKKRQSSLVCLQVVTLVSLALVSLLQIGEFMTQSAK